MELFIVARFRTREGQEVAAEAAMRRMLVPTRNEPGCLAIAIYRSVGDPRLFWVQSHWADEEAFEAHARQPFTVRFLDGILELIDHQLDVARMSKIA